MIDLLILYALISQFYAMGAVKEAFENSVGGFAEILVALDHRELRADHGAPYGSGL